MNETSAPSSASSHAAPTDVNSAAAEAPKKPRPVRERRPAAAPPPPEPPLIPAHLRPRLALLAVAFLALFAETIYRLGLFAWHDGNWSHAFLVPVFSAFFLHQNRRELHEAAARPSYVGLPFMLAALGVYFYALAIGQDMVKGYAMIATLFSLVLLLGGWAVIRVVWFPILYLAFGVKISHEFWEVIAYKLQIIAAQGSTFTLQIMGLDAIVTATQIQLFKDNVPLQPLNVAEACSGMRMLMTFAALGVAVAYMWDRPWWARLAMVLATVPIAVLVNVGRVTVLGYVSIDHPEMARGDFHIMLGMLMLGPALLLFLATGWMLSFISPDEPVKKPEAAAPAASANAAAPSAPRYEFPRTVYALSLAVLLIAAAGLWGSTAAFNLNLFKRAAELRQPLYLLGETIGPYQRRAERRLSEEMTHELGTHRYIVWDFADLEASRAAAVAPELTFHFAYYSGDADSRPQVHRRSYVLQQLEPKLEDVSTFRVRLASPTIYTDEKGQTTGVDARGATVRLPAAEIPVASFAAGTKDRPLTVAFLFIANGAVYTDPAAVRSAVFDLTRRSAYWGKLELHIPSEDPAVVRQTVERFLSAAMPAIYACLPELPPVERKGDAAR